VLVDAKISYKPTDRTELYLRGENLLDQKYEVVKGYGTPGLGVFAGFKATF
jgi:vitamin B12 transporter